MVFLPSSIPNLQDLCKRKKNFAWLVVQNTDRQQVCRLSGFHAVNFATHYC